MIPYSRQIITSQDIKNINKVLKSNFLTQGPKILEFEKKIAKISDAKYSISFNSATSALHIACLALDVKKNDIIWTCTNSFVASANCAEYCGAKIDLVDIDPISYNISIEDLKKKLIFAKKKNILPKVLIPVHFSGKPCDLKSIYELSKKYKFKIIEDASHAIGAKYRSSKIGSCKYSDITVFSFHPVKIITTGEGGAATTNSKSIYEKLNMLKTHGITRNKKFLINKKNPKWYYEMLKLGYNYKMSDIQASLGISQLKNIHKWLKYRELLVKKYNKSLSDLPIITPEFPRHLKSANHLYVIQLKKNKKKITRNSLYSKLNKLGISTNVHYIPIHTHPHFKRKGIKYENFPNANKYFKNCLSLPMYAGLSILNQRKVIKALRKILL